MFCSSVFLHCCLFLLNEWPRVTSVDDVSPALADPGKGSGGRSSLSLDLDGAFFTGSHLASFGCSPLSRFCMKNE